MKVVDTNTEESWKDVEKSHRRGKVLGGLLIVAIGSLFLAKELGVEIPFWVFSWKTLLIGIGLVLAIKHKFRHPGWIVLIGVGGVFLMGDLYPALNFKPILWPSILILIGLAIMFKPRNKHLHERRLKCRQWRQRQRDFYRGGHGEGYKGERSDFYNREEPVKDDYIDSFVFMAGVKKNILSKNFKGGEVTNVFGGSELDLTQADFIGSASLELTQVFGGTKLIVPANWEIKSELVTVLGSVEDKRPVQPNVTTESPKVLVLTGTTVFGGIEIKSY